MTSPSANPDTPQTPFFKKFLGSKLATDSSSSPKNTLVESVIRQAEKKTDSGAAGGPAQDESDNKNSATLITIAHAVLSITILAALGAWLYFFAILDTGNVFHAKFGKQNLTTQLIETQTLNTNLTTSLSNTELFSAYLAVESFANRILGLSLEDSALNYEAPTGELIEKVNREGGATELVYRIVDGSGRLVDIPEADVRAQESTKNERIASYQGELIQILEKARQLQTSQITSQLGNAGFKTDFDRMIDSLLLIDPIELQTGDPNFPTRFARNQYDEARSAAKSIRTQIKEANLVNLVTDLKKQVETVDLTGADTATRATVQSLADIIANISAKRTSSFETALTAASQLNFATLSPLTVATQVAEIIEITGATTESGQPALRGDLVTAAELARNLGAVNIISQLDEDRIEWSKRITQIGTIARYGADSTRDGETTPTDARRDIDLSNELVVFTGYSGKSKDEKIVAKGQVIGRNQYQELNFTLLADLLDALAGSTEFRDVAGFTFSKNKNPQGQIYVPFSIELSLQYAGQTDSADVSLEPVAPLVVAEPLIGDTLEATISEPASNTATDSTTPAEDTTTPATEAADAPSIELEPISIN